MDFKRERDKNTITNRKSDTVFKNIKIKSYNSFSKRQIMYNYSEMEKVHHLDSKDIMQIVHDFQCFNI